MPQRIHRPLVFLDRDGTIVVDHHYLADPDRLKLLPGVVEGLKTMMSAGYRLAIVTNQSGVARGLFSMTQMTAVNDRLIEMLASKDIAIDAVASCPHSPSDNCQCRKPRPGLALTVLRETGGSFDGAIVVGDKQSDIGLADAIGVPGILIADDAETAPDFGQTATVKDLLDAAVFLGAYSG